MSTYIPIGYRCPIEDCGTACMHLIVVDGEVKVECCECGVERPLAKVLAELGAPPSPTGKEGSDGH